MKLLLLGTTGYHPNDRRETACLMLPEIGLVFDAGTGIYRIREHLCTQSLDIFLSHAHLDHIVGLTYLFDILHEKDVAKVTVHGDQRTLDAIDQHLLAPPIFPVKLPCRFQVLQSETKVGGGGVLTSFPLQHPGGSHGYRVDWPDRSMAYVTDTTAAPDADYIQKIRNVDLLVHECYFPDSHAALAAKTGHSCTTAVAELAAEAGVGKLVLVHMNPLSEAEDPIDLATAQRKFPNTVLGADRLTIEF